MFGIGIPEILIILAVALIFIGPKRLPEIARAIGKGYRELQRGLSGIADETKSMEDSLKKDIDPFDRPDIKEKLGKGGSD